jgi:hypothetical protein
MILPANTIKMIAKANPLRNTIRITNQTNSTVYIGLVDNELFDFENNGFPIGIYGVWEETVRPPRGYQGPIYVWSDTESDIRLSET